MRALTDSQAKRCERATTPRCQCRCAGRFHGAKRVEDVRTLPSDDPHRPAEPRPRRRRGPVDRATRELDEALEVATAASDRVVETLDELEHAKRVGLDVAAAEAVARAKIELDEQLAGVDRVRSAWRKVFGGGAP